VLDPVVRLNRNVSRSGHRFAVDVESKFFVDTFDLCVQKTQSLIVFNFMCEFDRIVTSLFRRRIKTILSGRSSALTVVFPMRSPY
jgi:hypothetical protein